MEQRQLTRIEAGGESSRWRDRAERRGTLHRIPERPRRDRQGGAGRELHGRRGPPLHAARSERLRQDDDAALDCGARAAARRARFRSTAASCFRRAKRVFVAPNRRGFGMVFQSYAIWPHMTVFENAAFPLEVGDRKYSRKQVRENVMRVLTAVQLDELADREATKLSGGQQQRLALARALVMEPALLLLDEPLSNLDAKLREQMRFELKRLQRELKITTVYVTHDQSEALALSHEIAVMNQGRIQQIGRPRDIYEHPCESVRRRLRRQHQLPRRHRRAASDGSGSYVVRTEIGDVHVSVHASDERRRARGGVDSSGGRRADRDAAVGRERLAGNRRAEGVSRRSDRFPGDGRLALAALASASDAAHAGRRRHLRSRQPGEVRCLLRLRNSRRHRRRAASDSRSSAIWYARASPCSPTTSTPRSVPPSKTRGGRWARRSTELTRSARRFSSASVTTASCAS